MINMKICFISRFYKPFVRGGAEIYVGKIAEKLAKKGHEIFVITPAPQKQNYAEKINNVKIYRISPLNIYNAYESFKKPLLSKIVYHSLDLFNLHSYMLIKGILKDENPDIAHINNYKGLSPLSFKAAKDFKIPIVFTAHDYSSICIRTNLLNGKGEICENPRIPCKIYNKIQKFLIQDKPDIVTAPSNFVLQKLESKGLFKNVKKIVLPNPIETGKRTEKDYDNINILFVGSLSKHKGPQILIKAFKKLKGDNLRVHILGKGPDEDRLKELARGDERITFHGFLTGKELMNMYKMANVTVVPSILYDNSPMVVYESFMCSTPVVASRIGGIPELVKHGYNGFLFEPGDNTELAKILNMVSRDPEILKKLEIGAYKSSKKYDIEKHIDKLEEIYRSLT